MKRPFLFATTCLVGLAFGCAKLEKEKEIRIVVTGNSSVEAGSTLDLTADTLNGTDSAYTWESLDPTIATAADGQVFGRYPGETQVQVTGADTGAVALHPVVVIPPPQSLPNYTDWLGSAHADVTAEPFNHWNEDGEVPTECARCHSSPGFQDYLGADGSAFGSVEKAAPIGTVIDCIACHNDVANELSEVTFPSGVTLTGLGGEARCMTCHQGRASTDSVDQAIADAGAVDLDTPNADLHFQNIHYYAAGATLNAGRVRGGYQYTGKVYDHRFRHVPERSVCITCHNPHSLKVNLSACMQCHTNVTDLQDLKDIRMMSSTGVDYDGDGNLTEGVYYEMVGLRQMLLDAIQLYPGMHSLSNICYDEDAYPYWFIDTNGDTTCDPAEVDFSNQYAEFTPRLLKATYNYQVSVKDPGAFAHNAKYIIQLLYDSIEDLGTPISLAQAHREDFGHFNGAAEPARHWDEDDAVSPSCSSCHGASEGFRFYVQYGVGLEVQETANGLDCFTCHDNFEPDWDIIQIDSITFPGGVEYDNPGVKSNVCSTCHRGRESGITVQAAIDAGNFRFLNVHYLAGGAVKLGATSNIGYQYPSMVYATEWTTHPGGNECIHCHDPIVSKHSFLPEDVYADPNGCTVATCHNGTTTLQDIRVIHTQDYDQDGDTGEPLEDEIQGMADKLLVQMQTIDQICYTPANYPYWFIDTDVSGGLCDPGEINSGNRFSNWTGPLMGAAHNYQISQKEPGAWAHNFDYMGQLLYDSYTDLGGAGGGLIRP